MQTNDADTPESISPSLRPRPSGPGDPLPAYEFKFLLDEPRAREVADRLRPTLALDPHADPALGGAYAVMSLYCDTPIWSVYFREGPHRTRKYRVRRYGRAPEVYLERKTVRKRRVQKRRDPVQLPDLALAVAGTIGAPSWYGREVAARELGPVCRVRYLRQALFGACPDGPVRVTFDRSVRGALADAWSFDDRGPEIAVLPDAVVCEFKFRGAMPAALKRIAADMGLDPCSVSKYRECIAALLPSLGRQRTEARPHA